MRPRTSVLEGEIDWQLPAVSENWPETERIVRKITGGDEPTLESMKRVWGRVLVEWKHGHQPGWRP